MEAREAKGKTPLMLAISAGLLPTVELLIARGADVNAQSITGQGVWQFCPQPRGDQGSKMRSLLENAKPTWGKPHAWPRQNRHTYSLSRDIRYRALHGPQSSSNTKGDQDWQNWQW